MTVIDDEFETPNELLRYAMDISGIHPCIDVAADSKNHKFAHFLIDGLSNEWNTSAWMNCPHSETKKWVERAQDQWLKHNINILAIIPANSICTKYFEKVYNNVDIYPVFYRPRFLKDGKLSKFPSRNSYFVVAWRRR